MVCKYAILEEGVICKLSIEIIRRSAILEVEIYNLITEVV